MNLTQRIQALSSLGDVIRTLDEQTLRKLAESASQENPWFTFDNVARGLNGIAIFLQRDKLIRWTSAYDFSQVKPRRIGMVMAGNIPLVGFHDLLCVLISGHQAQLKLSSKDSKLMRFLAEELVQIQPSFSDSITFQTHVLKDFDAVIATGSDNSARHFEYYFGKYPHIIRRNRTSCAILTGEESTEESKALGDDVFAYFGLGCRNVSKIFIPTGYDLKILMRNWEVYQHIIHHHKYANNYDYQKSILLVNQSPFLDAGFALLQENEKLVSPIAVVYYEYYRDSKSLYDIIQANQQKLQCIVGTVEPAEINFGQAQFPEVWDYADHIDTLKFLTTLR
jgi:hypothetical protein